MAPVFLLVAAFFALPMAAFAAFPEVRFAAEHVRNASVRLDNVRGRLEALARYEIQAETADFTGMDSSISDISILGSMPEPQQYQGKLAFLTEFRTEPFELSYIVTMTADETRASLEIPAVDLLTLKRAPGLPEEAQWLNRGKLDAVIEYRAPAGKPDRVSVGLEVTELGFDSPDGRFAADSLAVSLDAGASLDKWSEPLIEGAIRSGEVLVDDFYRNFSDGEMQFVISPSISTNRILLRSFSLSDRKSLEVEGKAAFGLGEEAGPWQFEVNRLNLKFPGAYKRYMESTAAVYTLDGLGVTGEVNWNGEWNDGVFKSGDLVVTDLSIVDIERSRFAFTGLDARMRPGDYSYDSKLSWRGLLVGVLNLGPGELALDSEPGKFAIVQPLVLDVMGGSFRLNELSVLLPGGVASDESEPDIHLEADLDNLDMEKLTVAFGWPLFAGKVSGHVPGVSLNDGVLSVEGQILVNVFGGALTIGDLQVERAFGVLPSLAANIEVADLDLEQLTSTFSFGQISGRMDGYIHDLRMLDWKPVAFDAWFGTPLNQKGTRDISRKAVNNLTTLGGGRATTALTSPVMKLFSKFSYKALGLGCRMQNNVCDIRGVSEDDESVLIMEGAGVPKITIRAFNRRVDWPQLVNQLVAVSDGDSVKIGN